MERNNESYEDLTGKAVRTALTRFAASLALAASLTETMNLEQACGVAGLDYGRIEKILPQLIDLSRPGPQSRSEEDNARHERWILGLLSEVTDDRPCYDNPKLLDDRVRRLTECVLAIPSFNDYEALIRTRSGNPPQKPRPGRPDDEETCRSSLPDDEHVLNAIRFLRNNARREYIRSGTTDLAARLEPDVRRYLSSVHVYIENDMSRLNDHNLMKLPGVKPAVIAAVYAIRNKR